ncbi:BTAD domain-containing putative transcriptional regulator [Actinomadura sp. 9N215]|uniref:AfsR/SARP family transcriptional regulator n=1 Tax=Actinomadura sp. 9N215 TaxID=3375150 RepID=UPI0037B87B6A
MSFLGSIEVTSGQREIHLAGQRQRALLSILALDFGRVVPTERIMDAIWNTQPPATARTKLHAHVSALRQTLGQSARDQRGPLITASQGYKLSTNNVELDIAEFFTLTGGGQQAQRAGQYEAASDLYGEALALWRGPAFADVTSAMVRAAAVSLDQHRFLVAESKAEVDLLQNQADMVVRDLSGILASQPLRERSRGLLMKALYSLGCRVEALELYREGHQLMVAELGVEPSAQLRTLHQRILADDE